MFLLSFQTRLSKSLNILTCEGSSWNTSVWTFITIIVKLLLTAALKSGILKSTFYVLHGDTGNDMHVISLTKDQNKGCIQRNHPKYMFLEEKYDHWKTCKPLIWKRDRGFIYCMHDRKISKYFALHFFPKSKKMMWWFC